MHYGSIGLLHLSNRASNALEINGINLIGDLVEAARCGFVATQAGAKSIAEIEEALRSLSRSVGREGRVDWLHYAAIRRFLIVPTDKLAGFSKKQFMRIFPAAVETAIESAFGARGKILFQEFCSGDASDAATSRRFGLTRQGTSLIREKVLRILRGALFNDDYRGCRFRFRHDFVAPFRNLKEALRATHGRAITYGEWEKILDQTWGFSAIKLASAEHLLFAIIDYQLVRPTGSQIEAIVLPGGRNVLPLRRVLAETADLLNRKFPTGISKAQLFRQLRRVQGDAVHRTEIPVYVKAISGVEALESNGRIRAPIDDIRRMTDQLERILREKRAPMHTQELAAQIGRYKGREGSIRSARNVGSAMSADKRFKAIGRSGVWILSDWKQVETRTIAEIAAGFVRQTARPMTEAELFERISHLRSVKQKSIGTLLREDGRFRRTKPLTWGLK